VGRDGEGSKFDLARWEQIFFGKSEIKDSTALPFRIPNQIEKSQQIARHAQAAMWLARPR
jgi:hypothetical protein